MDPTEERIREAQKSFPAVAQEFHQELQRQMSGHVEKVFLRNVRLGDNPPFPFFATVRGRVGNRYGQWATAGDDPRYSAKGILAITVWVNEGIPGIDLPDRPYFYDLHFGYDNGQWTFLRWERKYAAPNSP
jgi:hypothetical protein